MAMIVNPFNPAMPVIDPGVRKFPLSLTIKVPGASGSLVFLMWIGILASRTEDAFVQDRRPHISYSRSSR